MEPWLAELVVYEEPRVRIRFLFLLCAAVALAEPSRPSPPFTILRVNAPSLRVSQYRGKVVALAFIQTTCSHCQQLTTELNLISRDYAARGVRVLECAFNDDAVAAMPDFLQRFTPPFPVGYSTVAAVMSYLQYTIIDPRPLLVPQMVFIDRAGVIRAQYPGESDFFRNAGPNVRAQLDRMLGKK
jgi:thiol-disulfide isomerase/thioredoxin